MWFQATVHIPVNCNGYQKRIRKTDRIFLFIQKHFAIMELFDIIMLINLLKNLYEEKDYVKFTFVKKPRPSTFL